MQNKYFLSLLALLSAALLQAQDGRTVLKQAHTKYYQAPCKSYTFSQRNKHYKGDTLSGRSEWHEFIEFPDKFRINFGEVSEGNFVVFKNDSVFNYRKNKLVKMRPDSNTLLLLLGGMFYRDLEDVANRLVSAGYNLGVLSTQTWHKAEVYVIGAKEGDMTSNQVWIDKKTLRVLRIIEKLNAAETMDMRFESHQDWCKGYVETKVSFRRNGKLEQEEEYYNIKESSGFPE